MRSFPLRPWIVLAVCVLSGALLWQAAARYAPVSLGVPGAPAETGRGSRPELPVPAGLERTGGRQASGDVSRSGVHAGTPGRELAAAEYRPTLTFALLGDAAPVFTRNFGLGGDVVAELNALRPDLVFTLGNHINGRTRSAETYAAEAEAARADLGRLAMPLYHTAGECDVRSGTGDPADRRFEKLYQAAFGPLYYSVDFREAHFIVLYSEEASSPKLSGTQMEWLRRDLEGAAERFAQGGHVFVLVHRPLWQERRSNWDEVHGMLAAFNRREGAARGGAKVEGVFAGHERAFAQDEARDGIAYYTVGPTGASIGQEKLTGQMQHYTLVRTDPLGPQVALVEPGAVHGADFVRAADRAILAQIAAFDERYVEVTGALPQPVEGPVGSGKIIPLQIVVHLRNPLSVPLSVAIRLASARNVKSPTQKDIANPFTEALDSSWELQVPYQTRGLAPGQSVADSIALYCPRMNGEVMPPQLEFVVTYTDSRGRSVPTVLKRRLPLIPSAKVPTVEGVAGEEAWDDAVRVGTYSFVPRLEEKLAASPDVQFLADADHFYVKVHAEDKHPVYYDDLSTPANLLCDAVAVSFAPSAETRDAQVQRIVLLPFALGGPRWMTNNGVGGVQTALVPLDTAKHPVQAVVTREEGGYEVLMALPRKTIFGTGRECVLNVTVTDNDGGAISSVRSWAREGRGPGVWGRVKLEGAGRK